MSAYTPTTLCRLCDAPDLVPIMDFGQQYLASSFVKDNDSHPLSKLKVPLTVVLCPSCQTVQLGEDVDRELLFSDYFYRSGTNPMMRAALEDVVKGVMEHVEFADGDAALDIGCNDATMLMMYPDSVKKVGIDPASNIDWSHVGDKAHLVNDFFSPGAVKKAGDTETFKAITTIAMLYNLENLDGVVSDIAGLLAKDGVWCIQVSYLPALLDSLSFYDVCHEHLYYFSMETLENLLMRHGLEVYDASTNDVNGGSVRCFVRHKTGGEKTAAYHEILKAEKERKLADPATYEDLMKKVFAMKDAVVGLLKREKEAGNIVVGLGGSTKGNVLLQFFGIDPTLLPAISERNPEKVGLRTLGTDIELVSEEAARAMKPAAMLVLIWFFRDELLKRERPYLEAGGKLLFPMPHPHLVTADGEEKL